jgi:hypothetical protein
MHSEAGGVARLGALRACADLGRECRLPAGRQSRPGREEVLANGGPRISAVEPNSTRVIVLAQNGSSQRQS